MASLRLLFATLFAIVALTSAELPPRPNDVIVGSRVPGDHVIGNIQHITKDASYIGKIVTVTKTFQGDGFSKITQIRALDQYSDGNGATAHFIAGGVGSNFVTIKFESQRFRGIDFVVELYGR